MLALQLGILANVLGTRDGQLGPGVEDLAGFGARAALQLGFDIPGEVGPVAFAQDDIVAEGVDVFGVEEEAVHVEEAGADRREALVELAYVLRMQLDTYTYCGLRAAIFDARFFWVLGFLALAFFPSQKVSWERVTVIYQGADGLIKGPNKLTANELALASCCVAIFERIKGGKLSQAGPHVASLRNLGRPKRKDGESELLSFRVYSGFRVAAIAYACINTDSSAAAFAESDTT